MDQINNEMQDNRQEVIPPWGQQQMEQTPPPGYMAPPPGAMPPGPMGNMMSFEDAVRGELTRELMKNAAALPQGFNKDRFILNALTMVTDKRDDLQNISPISLALCLAKGAYLGLDFLNRECYAINYKGVAQFQTDYKGEIKLAKKYSLKPVAEIYAKNVREGDFYEEVIENGLQSVNFKPKPFNNGRILGTFAVIRYTDGTMLYDSMSREEIEKTRENYSRARNSPAWAKSAPEMYKKTVIRRLLKLAELEFDNEQQIKAFQDGADADFSMSQLEGRRRPQTVISDSVPDVFAP